jgi:hypothetical protein
MTAPSTNGDRPARISTGMQIRTLIPYAANMCTSEPPTQWPAPRSNFQRQCEHLSARTK